MSAVGAREILAALGVTPVAETEGEALERVRAYEELKSALSAAQARETVRARELREAAEAELGIPAERRCRGFASEVALARRESPSRGSRHVGLARALVDEMPRTMDALARGHIDEWKASLVARETAWLSSEDRRRVDAEMGQRLESLGTRRIEREARALAQSLDAQAAVEHLRRKESERCVSIRPAPDAMAYLTALLPMKQAVAAFATLDRDARTMISTGEAGERGRGQVMADLFVERVTGVSDARDLPVEVHLVMTDETLLRGGELPAWVPGQGPVPAERARGILSDDETGEVWVRRLYSAPDSAELVSMDSRRRLFPPLLRRFIALRDDVCRTPWCEAPIRHTDHVVPHGRGGATSASNASGLCERCNQTKELSGWRHSAGAGGLTVATPTGRHYAAAPNEHPLLRAHAVRMERARVTPSAQRSNEPPPPISWLATRRRLEYREDDEAS